MSYKRMAVYAFLWALTAAALMPMVYTFANSFIGQAECEKYYGALGAVSQGAAVNIGNPFHMLPDRVSLSGYYDMLLSRPHYLMRFWASLGISGAIMAGQLVVAALGGYAFAKFRFPGRDAIFFVIIIIMMMPLQVTLPPNFLVLHRMGLIGSYYAVILPGIFSAFGIFLMRQFIAAIPNSMLEAAKIDGAGNIAVLARVVLPNCTAGLSTLAVLSFVDSWNMVEAPLVLLTDAAKYPLAVFLTQVSNMEPSLTFACGVLSIAAPLLLLLFFNEEVAEGIGYSIIK